eukprot:1148992-Pelagomonas_calceolata.AAC.3
MLRTQGGIGHKRHVQRGVCQNPVSQSSVLTSLAYFIVAAAMMSSAKAMKTGRACRLGKLTNRHALHYAKTKGEAEGKEKRPFAQALYPSICSPERKTLFRHHPPACCRGERSRQQVPGKPTAWYGRRPSNQPPPRARDGPSSQSIPKNLVV